MPRNLDPLIVDVLKKYGEDGKTACWDCHGVWVVYHKALERVAAKAGIKFGPPAVLEANGDTKCVALCVTGIMGDKAEWSIGEASPHNYLVKGKQQAYPYAMAEKRGKDRVILKLIGLHGVVYSEEEADDFKDSPKPQQEEEPKNAPGVAKARQWVNEHVRVLHAAESPKHLMEMLDAATAMWVRIKTAYPGLWSGPDGSGLRGEALKCATIYEVRDEFDLFLSKIDGLAEKTQQQAAE